MPHCFEYEHLTFSYPEQACPALHDLTFSIESGQFVTLCGPSGGGKSTLLRQMKTVLAPHGIRSGRILFNGTPLDELGQREQSTQIGFVLQSPDNQVVTDKVWHELAFGLESLGCDTPTIRGRVAEMASFFGIQTWFYKDVSELSGGQKQLLNLAAIMTMQPSVLLLDEPTSQLDPIAAGDFLAALGKINRELGTTVVISEHRLEEVFPLSDRVLVMEQGRLLADGTPASVGQQLCKAGHSMFLAMPTAMRVWAAVDSEGSSPVTVRDGRNWLQDFAATHPLHRERLTDHVCPHTAAALELKDVWFKYNPSLPDVVKGLNLTVSKGEFLAILGGNGTGKTTMLSVAAGLRQPYRGKVGVAGAVGLLPQSPQTLFVKKTVREDLLDVFHGGSLSSPEKLAKVSRAAHFCRLETLLDRHPYDLSGGEQQRAALCKILLLEPSILLLDEPTKGLDAAFKQTLAYMLKALAQSGVTILMVSHDVEFCAAYADRCALFFDGAIVTSGPPHAFFSANSFYTTSASRISRGLLPNAITAEDVIAACGGTLPPPPPVWEDVPPAIDSSPDIATSVKQKHLPLWRRLGAGFFALGALVLLWRILAISDLGSLINAGGITTMGAGHLWLCGLLLLTLFLFALCVTRRSHRPTHMLQTPTEKRNLSRRTVLAAGLILFLIPLTLFIGVFYLGGRKYYFISLLILLEVMLPFFLVFEGRKPQARELVMIAVLCALGVVGRAAFFALPECKPVIALTVISGVALGGETGFLVGAMTMLLSNVLFGQGQWTPFQMFAMGMIGFLAGILFRKGLLARNRLSLCLFGALSALVIYGGIMNPTSALIWAHTLNWRLLLTYYLSGFPTDCIHAAATWLFLWFAGEPMLEKLDRVKVKYGLVE